MPIFSSNFIYTPESWLTNHVLQTDEEGRIISLRPRLPSDHPDFYEGILCPGFINCHCHLELSSMRGLIGTDTGMTGFVSAIVEKRQGIEEAVHLQAIQDAMEEAFESGTVAIGDICNTSLTVGAKKTHPLFTRSFIELLGLNSNKANEILSNGFSLLEAFSNLSASITSHAPYSMSSNLVKAINRLDSDLLSIHLLESKEERQLFEKNDGPFVELYQKWGIPFKGFETKDAIDHITNEMNEEQYLIFIHNTELTDEELKALTTKFPQAYFCLCPRSNQYIHNTFPDIYQFLPFKNRICLGTDSLASNHSLNMLDEVKAIVKNYPDVDLHILLKWLTTNGAKALRQGINFGIFAAGKKPGVNVITNIKISEGKPLMTENSDVLKLV